ncbi:hypothetical protein, partial [Bacillus cereus group sp. Bce002]|uniref:hypothetical protein n=1 Tax=Bacillus cereus group sp. Bce002 TaxID=3445259 RepID=UPI003F2589E1
VYNTLKDQNFNNASYFLIAQKIDVSKTDFDQMKKFMQAGNKVFIASYDFGKLEKELKIETSTTMSADRPSLNFTNPNLKTDANYGFERGIGT